MKTKNTMKALVKKEAKKGLWFCDVTIPSIKHHEVLIKIKKTAICGTDLHIYNWDHWAQENIPIPLTVGHEYIGVIEKLGDSVTHYKVGDRVSGEGHIVCEHCRNCRAGKRHLCNHTISVGVNRNGAFAEYLALPASNVFPIEHSISDDLASIFDPFGNATHTALTFNLVGEDVLITGAGPIGCMATAICKHVGARYVVVTDVNEYRLSLAKELGADRIVHADKQSLATIMQELKMKEGFDVGLEMSGNPAAFKQMIENMNNGGKIALLGIFSEKASIDWNKVVFKGMTIKGIYGREMYETWYKMSSMLQSGLNLNKIITHQFKVADFKKGFELLNKGQAAKVILNW